MTDNLGETIDNYKI